ncbi:hypothetical protein BSU04_15595 [Caballeronia sordidicola]|uniref:Uncharacterized protein n=1 Tax=Caballeronia sordidicola TaxID=196367 RepID=A0A226X2K8_CABSO|nr:hypothetical protein BSU04_15595 [Caballeronia sordidicola]
MPADSSLEQLKINVREHQKMLDMARRSRPWRRRPDLRSQTYEQQGEIF